MKVAFLSTIFSLASLFTCSTASISLSPFPGVVGVGETYTLNWTATTNYTYTLWLVLGKADGNSFSWSKAAGLASGLSFSTFDGGYTWTVPSNLSTQGNYALWLNGLAIPFSGSSYANITNWFKISSSASGSNSGNPSMSSSATLSATSGATLTGTPSETSHAAASDAPSGSHGSLSGGTIAGIVVGCIVGLAFIIGALLFFTWRRKQSSIKKREAAARANRLVPVMQETPQANKAIVV